MHTVFSHMCNMSAQNCDLACLLFSDSQPSDNTEYSTGIVCAARTRQDISAGPLHRDSSNGKPGGADAYHGNTAWSQDEHM